MARSNAVPSTVTVGAIVYAVRLVPGLRAEDDGQKVDGEIRYGPCEIRIEADLDIQVQRVTLWHEILHAILTQAGHREDAEAVIERLSYGIVSAIRDNPELGGSHWDRSMPVHLVGEAPTGSDDNGGLSALASQ